VERYISSCIGVVGATMRALEEESKGARGFERGLAQAAKLVEGMIAVEHRKAEPKEVTAERTERRAASSKVRAKKRVEGD